MSTAPHIEGRLHRYLLGRLPEHERLEFEERLLADEDLDEELLVTTDEIIDAYLDGALSPDDRLRFETEFLASPEHRERLALIRALRSAVEQASEKGEAGKGSLSTFAPRRRRWLVLAAAAVVLVAAGGGLVLLAPRSPEGVAVREPTPNPQLIQSTRSPPRTEPESSPSAPSRTDAAVVVRMPRDSRTPVSVPLSPQTQKVRVEIAVNEVSPSFDVALRTAEGREVWRAEGLAPKAPGKPLILTLPAVIFASSDRYTLRVQGERLRDVVTPMDEYEVHVVRER
jgi:hypothetical protein